MTEKTINRKDARIEAKRIIAYMAYSKVKAISQLTHYTNPKNIKLIEVEFHRVIQQLSGISK